MATTLITDRSIPPERGGTGQPELIEPVQGECVGHRAAIDSSEQDGVRVIAVRGDVDITRAGELQLQLRDAVWGFAGDVLIEVDAAYFIDASTLSALARASLRVRRSG